MMRRRCGWGLGAFAVVAACGCGAASSPVKPSSAAPAPATAATPLAEVPRETPDAPFRAKAPDASARPAFVAPAVVAFRLPSGLNVLLVERHGVPIVSVAVAVAGGAGDFGAALRPGVAAFTGAMLAHGTTSRSALELSDAFESLGARWDASVGWSGSVVEASVPAGALAQVVPLLADVARHPAFAPSEIEDVRTRTSSAIAAQKDEPHVVAQNALAAALFGRAHPYGHNLTGTLADVKAIRREDLVAAHARLFDAGRASLVVAGDTTRAELEPILAKAFDGWKPGGMARVAIASPKPPARHVVLVDQPGATQSQVFVAGLGVAAADADRVPTQVLQTIFGGMFSSRVNMNLREAHAYTYGAYGWFDRRRARGAFQAGGAMVTEHTADAARELVHEVARMRDTEPTAEELSGAVESGILEMNGWFESVAGVRSSVQSLAMFGLPMDEYAKRPALLEAVTAADVRTVARAHLDPEHVVLVVVGDRAKIEPSLRGLELGPIEIRDAYGDLVANAPR